MQKQMQIQTSLDYYWLLFEEGTTGPEEFDAQDEGYLEKETQEAQLMQRELSRSRTSSVPNIVATSKIIIDGWLEKQGDVRKSWKKRWFVLETNDNKIKYSARPDDKELGFIPLEQTTKVTSFE